MLIKEDTLQHWINRFYGYGSWNARTWFVSYEETGGDLPEEVAEKIDYFTRAHPSAKEGTLCDIRELYTHVTMRDDRPRSQLYANRFEYRFGSHAVQSSVWKNLISFQHSHLDKKLPDPLAYQQSAFADKNRQSEALIILYPLPSPHNHAWYYSWLDAPQLPFIKSRPAYEEHVYPDRILTILSNIRKYKPSLVLMYGMNNINSLKQSVQNFFDGAKFQQIKSIKRQIPQHHRVDLGGTTLVITTQIPALRHSRIETGFDWEEFGKRVRLHK